MPLAPRQRAGKMPALQRAAGRMPALRRPAATLRLAPVSPQSVEAGKPLTLTVSVEDVAAVAGEAAFPPRSRRPGRCGDRPADRPFHLDARRRAAGQRLRDRRARRDAGATDGVDGSPGAGHRRRLAAERGRPRVAVAVPADPRADRRSGQAADGFPGGEDPEQWKGSRCSSGSSAATDGPQHRGADHQPLPLAPPKDEPASRRSSGRR